MKKQFSFLALLVLVGCSQPQAPIEGPLSMDAASGLVGAKEANASMPGFSSTVIIYQNEKPMCTGTLIDARMVLTAGHCLANRSFSDFEIVFPVKSDRSYQVVASQLHHDFFHSSYSEGDVGRSNNRNDLAILVLDEAAPDEAQIAPLASASAAVGESLSLVAFGAGRSKGAADDGGTMQSVLLEGHVTDESPLKISFDQRAGSGLCKGDSGGPIYKMEMGRPVLFGVISSADRWALKNGRLVGDICEYFGLATQVGAYNDWIIKTKKQLSARIR